MARLATSQRPVVASPATPRAGIGQGNVEPASEEFSGLKKVQPEDLSQAIFSPSVVGRNRLFVAQSKRLRISSGFSTLLLRRLVCVGT